MDSAKGASIAAAICAAACSPARLPLSNKVTDNDCWASRHAIKRPTKPPPNIAMLAMFLSLIAQLRQFCHG